MGGGGRGRLNRKIRLGGHGRSVFFGHIPERIRKGGGGAISGEVSLAARAESRFKVDLYFGKVVSAQTKVLQVPQTLN